MNQATQHPEMLMHSGTWCIHKKAPDGNQGQGAGMGSSGRQ